jgi:hypothetical protein
VVDLSKLLRKIAQHRPLASTHTQTATHGHVARGSRVGDEAMHFDLEIVHGAAGESQWLYQSGKTDQCNRASEATNSEYKENSTKRIW